MEYYKSKVAYKKYRTARAYFKKADPADGALDKCLLEIDEALKLMPENPKFVSIKRRLEKEKAPLPSCYQIGYRIGFCAAKRAYGFECNPENIPRRCNNKNETFSGMQDGTDGAIRSLPDFLS